VRKPLHDEESVQPVSVPVGWLSGNPVSPRGDHQAALRVPTTLLGRRDTGAPD